MAFACGACLAVKEQFLFAKANPAKKTFCAPVLFPQRTQGQDTPAVQQPEIPGVRLDWNLAQAGENPVIQPGAGPFEDGFPLPGDTPGVHILVPRLPALQHPGDQLGRILQIRVQENGGIAPAGIDSRQKRRLLAEIPGQAQNAKAGILGGKALQQLIGLVLAAVVNQEKFELVLG